MCGYRHFGSRVSISAKSADSVNLVANNLCFLFEEVQGSLHRIAIFFLMHPLKASNCGLKVLPLGMRSRLASL